MGKCVIELLVMKEEIAKAHFFIVFLILP